MFKFILLKFLISYGIITIDYYTLAVNMSKSGSLWAKRTGKGEYHENTRCG